MTHKIKTFLSPHMKELKKRLLRIAVIFLGLFGLSFFWGESIFQWLAAPLFETLTHHNLPPELVYTHLAEAFSTYVQVSFFAALLLIFPYMEWEIWQFMAPGLLKQERANTKPLLMAAPLLFILGASLCYYYVIPNVWGFFIQFSSPDSIRLLPQMESYLSLTMKFIFSFGLCFQLPLIMLLLAHIGIGNSAFFAKQRRFVIVGIFVVAAILTPPDVLSQVMLALPLLGLYELSILLMKIKEKKDARPKMDQRKS